jgi:hypothetical protein
VGKKLNIELHMNLQCLALGPEVKNTPENSIIKKRQKQLYLGCRVLEKQQKDYECRILPYPDLDPRNDIAESLYR